jgi:hypothetical protein
LQEKYCKGFSKEEDFVEVNFSEEITKNYLMEIIRNSLMEIISNSLMEDHYCKKLLMR